MMEFDSIVAGAGIWGCTVARRLAEAGRKVLVLNIVATYGRSLYALVIGLFCGLWTVMAAVV